MHETTWSILTDPAHIWAEVIMMIIFDGLLGALLFPLAKRTYQGWRSRLHVEFDLSHGVDHDNCPYDFVGDGEEVDSTDAARGEQLTLAEAYDSIVEAGLGSYTPPTLVTTR